MGLAQVHLASAGGRMKHLLGHTGWCDGCERLRQIVAHVEITTMLCSTCLQFPDYWGLRLNTLEGKMWFGPRYAINALGGRLEWRLS